MEKAPIFEALINVTEVRLKDERIMLAFELFLNGEVFPFPGIKPDSYNQIKADQQDELEMAGFTYTAPIDELLERFEDEGLKVVLGKHPESGNVFILPSGSDDIEQDSLLLRNLTVDGDIDERLLNLLSKA